MTWLRRLLARITAARVSELEAELAMVRRECAEATAVCECYRRRCAAAEQHIADLHGYRHSAGMCWSERVTA